MVVRLRSILISYVLLEPVLYIVLSIVSQNFEGNIQCACSFFQFLTVKTADAMLGISDFDHNTSATKYFWTSPAGQTDTSDRFATEYGQYFTKFDSSDRFLTVGT